MKYLLDTCLLSELVKAAPEPSVTEWVGQRKATDLFVSAVTIGELHRGVAKMAVSKRRTELTDWLEALEVSLENQMLPFTHEIARIWATMCAQAEAQGRPLAMMDSLIAATALTNGLTLVTRNVKDFSSTRVDLVNPWGQDLADKKRPGPKTRP
ncbi:MAG: type II toxin-antitoxin system VapC family toxin [Burkholderiaceae bacterium]|nr:type II toxin-antitoxin system VapC family toxin [Burkholderiaceae bacterium]